ncbi:MAG: MATE family efflux transporter [bacterium]|nr:MATE family efflux transporter [bacterium]
MAELENNNYFVKHTLRKYLAPTIISILGTTMITFVNSLLTGNMYGKEALAAMNLINPITFIFAMFGCLISIGSSTGVSIAMGKEEDEQVSAYATLALILSVAIPIIFSVVGVFFFQPFFGVLGVRGEWLSLASGYGRVMLLGGVFTTLMYYPFNFLRVDGRGQYSMMIFGVMGVLDVIFVFAFYRMGLGLVGVGLAVVLSTAIADALGMGILLFGKGRQIRYGRIAHPLRDTIQICRIGAAAALNNLCNMLRTVVLNGLVLSALGADGASMFAVACSVLNFAMAFVAGAGQAVAPIVGVFFGERDDTSIRMLMKSAIRYALILMSVLFVLTAACSIPLARAFGMQETIIVYRTAGAICFIMISLIPAAVVTSLIFHYTTIGQGVLASILTFLRSFGFVALFAWLFVQVGMERWMLAAFVLGELATLGVIFLLVRLIRKQNPGLEGVLLLRRQADDRFISFSVPGNAEGAVNASARMSEFCEQQEMDMRYAMMLPLALEEMLVLVNEHCFEGNEQMYADVRILCSQDEVLLRIRCGGKIYDPVAEYQKRVRNMSEEELLMDESLGIRMISESAKAVIFRRTLGVNNLVVIL